MVRNEALFEQFQFKNDHFAKTEMAEHLFGVETSCRLPSVPSLCWQTIVIFRKGRAVQKARVLFVWFCLTRRWIVDSVLEGAVRLQENTHLVVSFPFCASRACLDETILLAANCMIIAVCGNRNLAGGFLTLPSDEGPPAVGAVLRSSFEEYW